VDEQFLKMQTFVEQFTELSVPSGSLIAKSIMDPKASGLMPGSLQYEAMKSMGMFKSFVAAFVVNQVHMVNMTNRHWLTGTYVPKTAYVMEMVGTMMVAGALAIQVGEMLSYRDPQDMSQPDFWGRAMLRGGGLGPLGDLLTVGTTTWGGGAEAYVAGPVIGAFGDVAQLVGVNAFDAIGDMRRGESVDTGFLMEARDVFPATRRARNCPSSGKCLTNWCWISFCCCLIREPWTRWRRRPRGGKTFTATRPSGPRDHRCRPARPTWATPGPPECIGPCA
jgi:hypothetical protein